MGNLGLCIRGATDLEGSKVCFTPFSSDAELLVKPLPTSKLNFTAQPPDKKTVVLVACGSFSPPTCFHLRLMEDAKDALVLAGYHVAGGFLSPVHQKYGKKSLVPMYHRANMLGLALQDSDWLDVDVWECAQPDWMRTALVLTNRFQESVNQFSTGCRAMFVCGGDLLESFVAHHEDGTPIWSPEDRDLILGDCGVVCMKREGTDLAAVIETHPELKRHRENVVIFEPTAQNNISSTLVRELLQKGRSIKYMVHEDARNYIVRQRLSEYKAWGGSKE